MTAPTVTVTLAGQIKRQTSDTDPSQVGIADVNIGGRIVQGYRVCQRKNKKATAEPPKDRTGLPDALFELATHCAIQRVIVWHWEAMTGVFYN